MNTPIKGEIWKHFKGNLHRIYGVGTHTETGEQIVIYQLLADTEVAPKLWCRPLSSWNELVDGRPRFKFWNSPHEVREG